ncbi:MAG TPA: hypothetical protein V6C58_24110, partial [Allocoleopsis sp.]
MKLFLFPLRFSIPIILGLCGAVFGLISFNREITQINQKTEQEKQEQIRIYGGQIATILQYLYRRQDVEQAEVIISQMSSDPDLSLILLLDEQNTTLLSNHYELKNIHIREIKQQVKVSKENLDWVRKNSRVYQIISEDKQNLLSLYPVTFPPLPGEIKSSRVGIFIIDYNLRNLKNKAFDNAVSNSLISNGILMLFCLILWLVFDLILTRRVARLVAVSKSLARGNLEDRAKLSGADE